MLGAYYIPTQLTKTVAAIGTPERISSTSKKFRKAIFIGNKDARTANTGDVFLGPTSPNDTQAIKIATGTMFTLEAPEGQQFDLYDLYLDVATAADGVVVIYS